MGSLASARAPPAKSKSRLSFGGSSKDVKKAKSSSRSELQFVAGERIEHQWVVPMARVRIVSQKIGQGKYFKKKGVIHDVVSHKEWRLVLPSQPVRLRWGATLCRASSLMRMPCLPAGHIATGAVVHDSSTARGEASWDVLTEMLKMTINLVTMPP